MSIRITDDFLTYENSENRELTLKQKNFSLNRANIVIIGLKPMMLLDSDEYFFIIIDNKSRYYYLHSSVFDEKTFNTFLEEFRLTFDPSSLSTDDYETGNSFILFPSVYNGQKLYRKASFFSNLYLLARKILFIEHPAFGYLSKQSKKILSAWRS